MIKVILVKEFMKRYGAHVQRKRRDFAEDTLQISWHTPLTPSRYARVFQLDIKGRRRGESIKAVIRRAGVYV